MAAQSLPSEHHAKQVRAEMHSCYQLVVHTLESKKYGGITLALPASVKWRPMNSVAIPMLGSCDNVCINPTHREPQNGEVVICLHCCGHCEVFNLYLILWATSDSFLRCEVLAKAHWCAGLAT